MLQWIRPGCPGKLGAVLAGLVAQGDDEVEPLMSDRFYWRRLVACDVDAVAVPHHGHRVRVQWLRADAGTGCLDVRSGLVPQQRLGHRRAAGVPGAHEQHPPPGGPRARSEACGDGGPEAGPVRGAGRRRWRPPAPARNRPGRGGNRCRARRSCCAARSPGRRPQLAKVIRDQVLRLADRGCQLADPLVTGSQLPHQPPPHRLGQQPHHRRDRKTRCGHAFMLLSRYPSTKLDGYPYTAQNAKDATDVGRASGTRP